MPGRGRPFQKKYATEAERKAARKAASRAWYEANRELTKRRAQARYASDPARHAEQSRARKLKRQFDLTVEQYETMLKNQGGVCAICKRPPGRTRLAVDHCHGTGRVRGLLHRTCNTAIGLLMDDPKLVQNALEYLNG